MRDLASLARRIKVLVYLLMLCAVALTAYSFEVADRYLNPPISICGVTNNYPASNIFSFNPIEQASAEYSLGYAFTPIQGEKLFKANCNSCHIIGRTMTGPNLVGINERVSFDWAWAFMQDPEAFKATEDPYLMALLEFWEPKSGLHPRQDVSEQELKDILGYIEQWSPQVMYLY